MYMNRRKFFSGVVAAGITATAGCSTISGTENTYSSPSELSIELRNSQDSTESVQLLVESTTEYIQWDTYQINSNDNNIINIDIPSNKQFVALHIQYNDSKYTADFAQWKNIDGNCGSVIFEIREKVQETDLYYSTSGVGECNSVDEKSENNSD